MKLKDLLEEAVKQANNLNSGESFMVKELFRGFEWNRIDRGLRMNLGRAFLFEIEKDLTLNIDKLKKNSANQQIYIKK